MGGGCYSYMKDVKRKMSNSSVSREEVFKQRSLNPDMIINGKVRECRDSEEHPETLPIIIALDVTGSMGVIPHKLVTKDFPEIMKKIMDNGIEHPQVCFVGIGDQYSDDAPIQVGQFEASDELLDKWLKTIWLEGGGGGNGGESYQLAWYFAAHHVSADHIEKRNKKGVLITIGDEAVHGSLDKGEITNFFGNGEARLSTSEILKQVQEHWDVYHINLNDYSGRLMAVGNNWRNYLGDHVITTEDSEGNDIPKIIAGIILNSVNAVPTSNSIGGQAVVSAEPSKDSTTHIR